MDNKPVKKNEQEILLELQDRAALKARVPDILTVVTGLLILFALAVAMFIIPDKTFSEQENRSDLQQFPVISENSFLDRFLNGKFTSDMSKYLEDQFPFRDAFVGLKGIAEIALRKGENNDVILGKDNYLITKDNYKSVDQLMTNIDRIAEFAGVMHEIGRVPVTLAAAGRSVDALSIYLPGAYPTDSSASLWASFDGLANHAKNVNRVNLLTPLKQLIDRKNMGQLYYRTDHHWTTLGAYYAYVEIIKSFKDDGFEPLPLSAFEYETASDSFYGTTWSKAGMKWISPDNIYYFRYEGDTEITTKIADTGKILNGFYDRDYLEVKDKYSSFLSGNNARVDIFWAERLNRPKLLLIKDSFAHAVVPFLAYHYDIVMLDLRYFNTESVVKLVYDEGIDRVLFLHNIHNLSEDDNYGILQYGAEAVLERHKIAMYPIRNIFINSNPINDYVIVIPTEEGDSREYYIAAAEQLHEIILTRAGIDLEIVRTDDYSKLDKIIAFTTDGLPSIGFIKMATEGNNLMLRCYLNGDSPGYAVDIFISKYLKRASGSFNFGENFIYSDAIDEIIMIKP